MAFDPPAQLAPVDLTSLVGYFKQNFLKFIMLITESRRPLDRVPHHRCRLAEDPLPRGQDAMFSRVLGSSCDVSLLMIGTGQLNDLPELSGTVCLLQRFQSGGWQAPVTFPLVRFRGSKLPHFPELGATCPVRGSVA